MPAHRTQHEKVALDLLNGLTTGETRDKHRTAYATPHRVAKKIGIPLMRHGAGGRGSLIGYFEWRLEVRAWRQEQERLKRLPY